MRGMRAALLVWLGLRALSSLRLPSPRPRPLSLCATTDAPSAPWWKDGLSFKCTGCGRCCMNEGEVWLDSDEFHDLCIALCMSPKAAADAYVEQVVSGWVRLKNKPVAAAAQVNGSGCIFLDSDGKQCTIYENRPAQCRTYPYWPNLLQSREAFDAEGVLPDGEGGPSAKHWTPEAGGCEGVNGGAAAVPPVVVQRNLQLYNSYLAAFPFMGTTDDLARLLSSVEVIQAVVRSTRAWVTDFVLKYDLCPFARAVLESDRVRYRVFLGSDVARLKQRIKYEVRTHRRGVLGLSRVQMLHLLTVPEEEDATTLIIAPFAFPNFEDFHSFVLDYEDGEMRQALLAMRAPEEPSPTRPSRLVTRVREKAFEETKELQVPPPRCYR